MKIQINSLEALERLIGGDSELEFDIRQSVVETFAKKHLKSVVNFEVMQKLQKTLTSSIQNDLLEEVGSSYSKTYKLTPKAKEFLDKKLSFSIEGYLSKVVDEKLKTSTLTGKIHEQLEKSTDYIVNNLQETILSDKLSKLVDAKIKEKLGV